MDNLSSIRQIKIIIWVKSHGFKMNENTLVTVSHICFCPILLPIMHLDTQILTHGSSKN